MVVSLGLLSIAAVTAEGVQEGQDESTTTPAPMPGPGTAPVPGTPGYFYNNEKLSLEGTIDFTVSGAELTATDGKVYELMYPRFLADGIEIEDGQTIAVEGYLVPGPRWERDDEDTNLRVTMATIDGKEYDLPSNFGPAFGPYGAHPHGTRPYGARSGARGGAYGPGMQGPGMMGGYGYRR